MPKSKAKLVAPKIREQITPELLTKQCKAIKASKGDTEAAAQAMVPPVSYAGFLNRFRVSGLNYHEVRRQVLEGVSIDRVLKSAKVHESTKPTELETAIRSICRDEFRRMKLAA